MVAWWPPLINVYLIRGGHHAHCKCIQCSKVTHSWWDVYVPTVSLSPKKHDSINAVIVGWFLWEGSTGPNDEISVALLPWITYMYTTFSDQQQMAFHTSSGGDGTFRVLVPIRWYLVSSGLVISRWYRWWEGALHHRYSKLCWIADDVCGNSGKIFFVGQQYTWCS